MGDTPSVLPFLLRSVGGTQVSFLIAGDRIADSRSLVILMSGDCTFDESSGLTSLGGDFQATQFRLPIEEKKKSRHTRQ